jgi:hypothetical protein
MRDDRFHMEPDAVARRKAAEVTYNTVWQEAWAALEAAIESAYATYDAAIGPAKVALAAARGHMNDVEGFNG